MQKASSEAHPETAFEIACEAGQTNWWIADREYRSNRGWARLFLEPEPSGLPVVDEWHEHSPAVQLTEYARYVQTRRPHAWSDDAVPIYWSLRSECGWIVETAPLQRREISVVDEDFLSRFSWPVDAHGSLLDWFQLPVRFERFPRFWDELGWAPSPLQPYMPLRSLVASRNGVRLYEP